MPPRPKKRNINVNTNRGSEVKATWDYSGGRLPIELIEAIFLLVTGTDTTSSPWKHIHTACALAQVNRQAAIWMRPIIWRTVNIRNAQQLVQVYDGLLSDAQPSGSAYVRNIWMRSDRGTAWSFTPRADGYRIRNAHKPVIDELTAAKKIRNLAVDVALLGSGWFVNTPARPQQVLLLASEDPTARIDFDIELSLFDRTTYLIVEEGWDKMSPHLQNRLVRFQSLTHLCVRLPAGIGLHNALKLVNRLIRLRQLRRIIVCIDNGFYSPCPENNVVWMRLSRMAELDDRLIIMPQGISMSREWELITNESRSIWQRAHDIEERIPADRVEPDREDWTHFDSFRRDLNVMLSGPGVKEAIPETTYGICILD